MALGREKKHKLSQRGERRTARDIGGKTTPGSGSQWRAKGDVKSRTLLVERKDTIYKSFGVSLDILDKIAIEANQADRDPVLVIGLDHGRREYAVVPLADYLALREP